MFVIEKNASLKSTENKDTCLVHRKITPDENHSVDQNKDIPASSKDQEDANAMKTGNKTALEVSKASNESDHFVTNKTLSTHHSSPKMKTNIRLQDRRTAILAHKSFSTYHSRCHRQQSKKGSPSRETKSTREERRRIRRATEKYRTAHATRERLRVEAFNTAFSHLRRLLPTLPPDKKLSKIEVLRLAICYISYLFHVLETS